MDCAAIMAEAVARLTRLNLKRLGVGDDLNIICDADDKSVDAAIEQLFTIAFRQGHTQISNVSAIRDGSRIRIGITVGGKP